MSINITINNFVVVDEAESAPIPAIASPTAIIFRNAKDRSAGYDELVRRVAAIPGREKVLQATVDSTSALADLRILTWFPMLESLLLYGRKLQSLEALGEMKALKALTLATPKAIHHDPLNKLTLDELVIDIHNRSDVKLINQSRIREALGVRKWQWRTFEGLALGELKLLIISGGGARTTEGLGLRQCRFLHFSSCSKLEQLSKLEAIIVRISTCRRLPLHELGKISCVRSLYITNHCPISSFEFVSKLPHLIDLRIDATKLTAMELSPISRASSLQTVWLPKAVPDKTLAKVSKENVRLVLSNGCACFAGGAEVEMTQYQEAFRRTMEKL
jgi:hypothetical protein